MGSLMAGWDSHTLDPKLETRKRNRSLTKEEIAAYWKNKKEIEEEHLSALSNSPAETTESNRYNKELEKKCKKKSNKVALERSVDESLDMDAADTSLEQLICRENNGWWTKSSWAFLNEPPLTEASSNEYALQFHIASLESSKFNSRNYNDGISA